MMKMTFLSGADERVSRRDLGTFARQFAERTRSGASTARAICDIAHSTSNPVLRGALLQIGRLMEKRSISVDEAFHIKADVFPESFRNALRVGTAKGEFSDVLATYGARQVQIAEALARLQRALIYPMVVLLVALVAILVLTIKF